MNKLFKFLLDKFTKKTKLNADEKIGFLVNELIKELKASGRSIEVDPSFGCLRIWVHRLNSEDSFMEIENNANDWSFKTKPTFGEF